jgi:hypothetical protein
MKYLAHEVDVPSVLTGLGVIENKAYTKLINNMLAKLIALSPLHALATQGAKRLATGLHSWRLPDAFIRQCLVVPQWKRFILINGEFLHGGKNDDEKNEVLAQR